MRNTLNGMHRTIVIFQIIDHCPIPQIQFLQFSDQVCIDDQKITRQICFRIKILINWLNGRRNTNNISNHRRRCNRHGIWVTHANIFDTFTQTIPIQMTIFVLLPSLDFSSKSIESIGKTPSLFMKLVVVFELFGAQPWQKMMNTFTLHETRGRLWTVRHSAVALAKNDEYIHSFPDWKCSTEWPILIGRELKKRALIFIHRTYLRIIWICFIYLGKSPSNRASLSPLFGTEMSSVNRPWRLVDAPSPGAQQDRAECFFSTGPHDNWWRPTAIHNFPPTTRPKLKAGTLQNQVKIQVQDLKPWQCFPYTLKNLK